MISNKDIQVIKPSKNIRKLKRQTHYLFDKLWQCKYIERNELYIKLAEWLGVEEPKAHMSKMNSSECKQVIEYSIMMLNDMRRLDLDWGDEIQHPYYELKL